MGEVAVIVVSTERENSSMPRGTDIDVSAPTKLCPKCSTEKPWKEFHKSKSTVTGYQVYCKGCSGARHDAWRRQNLEKCRVDQKKHRDANPERHKDYGRKAMYGLAPGEYDRMLGAQKGKCAICQTETPGGKGVFHVDHCHEEGHVRGLLCHHCNLGIGHLQHSVEVLEAAKNYLTQTLQKMR